MKTATNERRQAGGYISIVEDKGLLARERALSRKAKKVALSSLGLAAQMNKLAMAEQQVIMLGNC